MTTTVRTVCACGTEHTHQCVLDWSQSHGPRRDLADALARAEKAEKRAQAVARTAREEKRRRHDTEATVDRVQAECDRLEAAVRSNPTHPDFDGAYLAAVGHIRTALLGEEAS